MKRRTRLAIAASYATAVMFAFPSIAFADTQHRVVAGDTLWSIVIANGTTWQTLAAYNHIQNPNLIFVDQIVQIPDSSSVAPAPAPVVTQAPVPIHHENVTTLPTQAYTAPAYGGFQACVAQRESGNGSGSGNIYGFLQSTWNSLGLSGSPGSASRAQQDAAFQKLYAKDGTSPWSPYDGC